MKKQILLLAILAFAIIQFWGCEDDNIWGSVKGSGNEVNVTYSFENFDKIDVSSAFELTVLKADTFSVVLFVDDNIVQYLDVSKSGNWLLIGMDGNHNYNNTTLRAEVRCPESNYLKGSGASFISMNGFDTTQVFNLELSGASVFSANLNANDCEILLSGASVMNINGSCTNCYIGTSGASVLNMPNFIIAEGHFNLSGASDGTIHVTDYLNVTLSGASVLRYYGNPEIGNVNISGASVLLKL